MTYPETIQYLKSFINYEKISTWSYKRSLKLERIKDFLATIDNPQDSLCCIHVAGTKGKGSTCAFITYILKEAGYKVGLYTSPHLSDFRERLRILQNPKYLSEWQTGKIQNLNQDFEGMISQDELADLVERLKPAIKKYNKNSKYGPLSFFEVYTSLAFVYFKEKKVDFAVLETGLGGRLDATNVVNPLVCAIAPISYEHTQKLGNTLKEIANEKTGIIKIQSPKGTHKSGRAMGGLESKIPNLIVISAPQEKEAMEVIRQKCKDVGARLYEVNKDIFYETQNEGFNIMGVFGEYPCLNIRLLGRHQLINATVAVGVIEALRFYNIDPTLSYSNDALPCRKGGINVDIDSIRDGLYNTVWPGRCEVISRGPLIILDGAQNVASARVLKEATKENFKYKKLILVLGISEDKDMKGICNELYDLPDEVILTRADNLRATQPEILAKYFRGKEVYITSNVKEAREKAKSVAKKEDLILVSGSLFVVGEFRDDSI